MTQGDHYRCHSNPHAVCRLAASIALGLAFTAAQAQIPGDAPGGAPQYRDSSGVVQPGSGAAGTTNSSGGTWTPAQPAASGSLDSSSSPVSSSPSAAPVEPMTTPSSASSRSAAGEQPGQSMDSTLSPRSSLDSEQMPLPSEPTAAGPTDTRYGAYDPARESWIPYTSSGYIGVSGGKPDLNTACVAGQSCDDPDSAWSIYLGGQFNPYLGLQLGYLQLQDADRNGGDTKVRGVNIVLTGALPLGSNFSLNGRVGGTYGWTKTSVGAGVAAPAGNEEGFGASYGVGASWDFDRHWSVTADWDRHHLKYAGDEKKNTDVASIGLRYRF